MAQNFLNQEEIAAHTPGLRKGVIVLRNYETFQGSWAIPLTVGSSHQMKGVAAIIIQDKSCE